MRKLLFVLALSLAGSGVVWADGIPQVVSATTRAGRTQTVYNDSGSALTSGTVVGWDTDDAEFDDTGYRYVTTTTSADSIWTAGVILDSSCANGSLCEIVVEGWAGVNVTGNLTEDTLVATSTTAGQMGDYTPAANTCALGRLIKNDNLGTTTDALCGASNFCQMPVYVEISCQ